MHLCQKGKKESDFNTFPVIQLPTFDVSEEVRIRVFGPLDNCRRMKDEVFRRLIYIPAGWKVEETYANSALQRKDCSNVASVPLDSRSNRKMS